MKASTAVAVPAGKPLSVTSAMQCARIAVIGPTLMKLTASTIQNVGVRTAARRIALISAGDACVRVTAPRAGIQSSRNSNGVANDRDCGTETDIGKPPAIGRDHRMDEEWCDRSPDTAADRQHHRQHEGAPAVEPARHHLRESDRALDSRHDPDCQEADASTTPQKEGATNAIEAVASP